jgi:hypothetical protein
MSRISVSGQLFEKPERDTRISASEVRQWLSEADSANRLKVPALADCEGLAQKLTEMKSLGPVHKVGPARHSKAREYLLIARKHLMLEREGESNKAQKYWRIALDHLAKEREAHAHQIAGRHLTNYHMALAGNMEAIEQIADPLNDANNTIEWINMLLDLWGEYPAPKWDWHHRARWIADMAQEAWRNAGRTPEDAGPNQPLCKFVTTALTAIGSKLSNEAVSSALRERRGMPKDARLKQSRK